MKDFDESVYNDEPEIHSRQNLYKLFGLNVDLTYINTLGK